MPLALRLSFILMTTFAFHGCATMQIPDYPKTPVSSYSNATTKNELCIAVHAMTEKKDLKQYFGTDLSALKIVPIYIVAENRSPSSSFLLLKDHVSLQNKSTQDGLKQADRTGTGESLGGEVAVVTGSAALLVVPVLAPLLLFPGFKAISDAEVVKHNLAAKELQTRTISPGKSVDGFVYFKLPDESGPLRNWYISIQARELGGSTSHQFTFTLE